MADVCEKGRQGIVRGVIQRVTEGSVTINNNVVSSIRRGIVVLLGVAKGDTSEDADFLVNKIANLRIFEDQQGKMNLSLLDINGEVLVVSQFTLVADISKGRRPSFDTVATPDEARRLYELFSDKLREKGLKTETGIFQAEMLVHISNDGPVTFVVDS